MAMCGFLLINVAQNLLIDSQRLFKFANLVWLELAGDVPLRESPIPPDAQDFT
ncbi:hypothetical protein PSP6_70128 [Paraburkholderia tropica]|nr:hypothetical protein PSP6_70128 [Paraburkholderia tropica]